MRDQWIVSDVGGTHARFNVWTAQRGLATDSAARHRNNDFADLVELINQYRRD